MTGVYGAVGCMGGRAVNGDWSGGLEVSEAVCRTAFGRSVASSGGRETGWGCGRGMLGPVRDFRVFVGQGDRGGGVEN